MRRVVLASCRRARDDAAAGRRADRITDTFAPEDDVDAHENDTIVDRETKALKNSYFWMADRKDGTYKGEFVVPEAQGEMLKNCLEALNAPQVKKVQDDPALAVLDDRPTYGQQMAVAFMTLIEHLPGDRLPDVAGVGVTVTVNIDLKSLIGGLKAGTLSTGCRVSAGQVRRMACEQALLPMVFNGKPLPVDCGREKRLFNRAQRRAAERRDRGCTFPGFDRPPSQPQVGRSPTAGQRRSRDRARRRSAARGHHRVVHAQDWEIRFANDGYPEYVPPASIDRHRRPLCNARFRADADAAAAAAAAAA